LKRATALAVLCAGISLAIPPGPELLRALAVGAGLLAVLIGPRLSADRLAETAGSGVLLAAGLTVAQLGASPLPVAGGLSERAMLLGLPMVLLAAFRASLAKPKFGAKLTLAAAIVGLVASGRVKDGDHFPVLCALFLALGVLGLRVDDPSRAPLRELSRRHWLVMASAAAVALTLATASGMFLPTLHARLLQRFSARWNANRVGFADSITLGSLAGLYQSDKVVARVRGEGPELLRGMVWDRYSAREWQSEGKDVPREVVETAIEDRDRAIEIEFVGSPKRYFAPLGAGNLSTSRGIVERDVYGALWVNYAVPSKRLWFDQSPDVQPREPMPVDLEVPRLLVPTLDRVLKKWSVSREDPPRVRVDKILSGLLREHRYSVDFDRDGQREPIIDFLTLRKEGHCEYFASAFTLLARRAEVPARLVGGYRVFERSPLGYRIVREKHAHAWSEVWLDQAWETRDPTPVPDGAFTQELETNTFSALIDGVRTGWEVVDDWLGKRSAFEFAIVLVVLGSGWLTLRLARQRRRRGVLAQDGTLPELEALLRALARRGLTFVPGATLTAIREGVTGLAEGERELVQQTLVEYERFIYGGRGDVAAIRARLSEASRGLSAARDRA
jgi:hypothetical protein